jgi:hypothetical protein
MHDDLLTHDADLSPIGNRVVASGWPLLYRVDLVKADASGVTVFPGGVAYGAPHIKVSLQISGQAIEGRPVVLDDDYLVGEGPIVGVVEPRRAVLDDCLHLAADSSDEAIVGYARQYGMLGLAPTGRRPGPEFVVPTVPWVGDLIAPSIGYRHAPGVLREPVGLWRRVGREMAAVYAIAGQLRRDKLVDRAAWDPLAGIVRLPLGADDVVDDSSPARVTELPDESVVPWILVDPKTLEGQRQALAAIVGAWLALGAVRPVIAWGAPKEDEPVVTLGVSSLFGGLVLELLLAVGGQAGFAICSGCGMPYVPGRRPPAGAFGAPRATYCRTCRGKNAAQNAAAQRWRDKHPGYFRNRRARAYPPATGRS